MMHRNLMPIGLMSIIGVIVLLSMFQPPHARSANTFEAYPPTASPTDYVIPTVPIDVILTETPIVSETPSEVVELPQTPNYY